MNEQILQAIDAEIARLQQARAILDAAVSPTPARGRKPASSASASRTGRRELSPQARKAIADAQKKRWAKVKREKKAAAAGKKDAAAS